jgi:homoaconitate hydratase
VEKVIIGEGSGDHEVDKAMSVEDALDKIITQAESMIVWFHGRLSSGRDR